MHPIYTRANDTVSPFVLMVPIEQRALSSPFIRLLHSSSRTTTPPSFGHRKQAEES